MAAGTRVHPRERQLGVDLPGLVRQLRSGRTQDRTGGRSRALRDLGVPEEQLANRTAVALRVGELEREFDQVLVLERLEEGLVLAAAALCWPLHMVVARRMNAREPARVVRLPVGDR